MPITNKSLLAVNDLDDKDIDSIFSLAAKFKADPNATKKFGHSGKVIITLFFEPSTRTRVSFQVASGRLGVACADLGSEGFSSLAKGETLVDTLYNVAAMKPDLIVIRHDGSPAISRAVEYIKIPVISGGDGTKEHPTQALLDAFTIRERLGDLRNQKVLYVGDAFHSRVAHSGAQFLTRLGAQVGIACPKGLIENDPYFEKCEHFTELEAGMKWASVVIGLRIQKERHSTPQQSFLSQFYLDQKAMAHLREDGLLMHPGPFVPGEDMERELLSDPRCAIHLQVENGVYVRMALLAQMLEMDFQL